MLGTARQKKASSSAASGKAATQSQAGAASGMSFQSGMQQNAPSAAGNQRNLQLKPGGLKKKKTLREPLKKGGDKKEKADSSKPTRAEQAKDVAKELEDDVSTFQDIQAASEQWAQTAQPDQEAAGDGLKGFLAKALDLQPVLDVFSAVTDFTGLFSALAAGKDKYQKFRAFSKTQVATKKNEKEKKLYQVALFAAKKAGWAFINTSLNIAEAIVSVMGTIAGLVGGGPLAVSLKAIVAIGGALKKTFKVARKGWMKWWGLDKKKARQREANTDVLMGLAAGGDKEAAKLLLNLGLTFVVGGHAHDAKRSRAAQKIGVDEAGTVAEAVGHKKFTSESEPAELCEALSQLQAKAREEPPAEASWNALHKELERAMESDV